MATPIQLRRGAASAWTAADPILRAGEAGVELETGPLVKIGDGVRSWTALPYLGRRPGWLDVRDFGAVGNGTTDDSAAIQAAINAAKATASNGYGLDRKPSIYVPPGRYRLATGLTLAPRLGSTGTDRVSFRGEGPRASTLLPDVGVSALTLRCGEGGLEGITLEGFGIEGGANGIVVSDVSPWAVGLFRVAVRDLSFTGLSGAGIYVDAAEVLETLFENCYADGCAYGGQFLSPANNLNTFLQCRWRRCTEAGLYLANAAACKSISSLYESNQKHGLVAERPLGLDLDGDWFEHNGMNVVGGPYAHIRLQAAGPAGALLCRNVQWVNTGANDGNLAIQVTTSDVHGPLVLDTCVFEAGGAPMSRIDVGTFAVKPDLAIYNNPGVNRFASGTGPIFTNPPTAGWLSPRWGTFTMSAAAAKTVQDSTTNTSSVVQIFPTNAAAAVLMAGPSSLYISASPPGEGFEVRTADNAPAAGTETFNYVILR